jgi:hypothetical protein
MEQDLGVRKSFMHERHSTNVIEMTVRRDDRDQLEAEFIYVLDGFVRRLARVDAYRLFGPPARDNSTILLESGLYK